MIELLFFLLLFSLCAAFDYAVFNIRVRRIVRKSARTTALSKRMKDEKNPDEFFAKVSLYPPTAYPELYPNMRFTERYFLSPPSAWFPVIIDEEYGGEIKMGTESGGAREESRSEQ